MVKAKTAVSLVFLAVHITGCGKASHNFEMTVEQVDELKGFIMKGISLSGEIGKGCIANDDGFIVKRDGQQVLETVTRVVNVRGLTDADSFGGEVSEGDYVTFFIPDGKKQDVKPGDLVVSNTTSCKTPSPEE